MSVVNNRTLDILRKAEEGQCELYQLARRDICLPARRYSGDELVGFDRLSVVVATDGSYDASSAIALVRAAERARSPAILQLFPVTLAYGKGPLLQLCLDL